MEISLSPARWPIIFSASDSLFVVILMGLLFYFHAQDGLTPHDLSWFFSFFVMLQFWNMFNAKAFMEGRSAFANLKDSKASCWSLY